MAEESKDDKQFEASEQKLNRARMEGDVPRSIEVNVLAMYLGFWGVFAIASGAVAKQWLSMATRNLGAEGWHATAGFAMAADLGRYTGYTIIGLSSIPLAAIFAGLIAQRSLVFSGKKLKFDIKRINPVKNAAQKFGKSGLMTFAISVGKAALICAGGWYLFSTLLDRLASTAFGGGVQWVPVLNILIMKVFLMVIIISAVFAVIDFLWKRHEFLQKLRMSRKEMEDEHKNSEGDPHMKAARRKKAVDIALKEMLADVEKADVIIVNPTHYAVALEWKRGSGRVPVCLAKGTDDVAARIRARADQYKVPIFSDPPSARALHATVNIGEEIRREHFAAVATAIRFAEAMRQKAREGW